MLPLRTDPGAHGGDPADAFDVVSVPARLRYSDRTRGPARDSRQSRAVADLMAALGYDRFGAAVATSAAT